MKAKKEKIIKCSPEIEKRVLGILIQIGQWDNLHVQTAMLQLTDKCFYINKGLELFRIVRDCYNKKHLFDRETVNDLLRSEAADLADYFDRLFELRLSIYTLDNDTKTLILLSHIRRQRAIAETMIDKIDSTKLPEDCAEAIRECLADIGSVEFSGLKSGFTGEELVERFISGVSEEGQIIPTGIECMDTPMQGGIRLGYMVVVAGAASVGKTFFAIYLMHSLQRSIPDKQSLFFSLEMSEDMIAKRHFTMIAGRPISELSEEAQLTVMSEYLQYTNTVYGNSDPNIEFIETASRLKHMEKPVGVIVVDYLGLVEINQKYDRNDLKITDIAKRLSKLSRELNCILIVLSHVNRDSAKRNKNDRCPYPSDSADSLGAHRSSSLWFGLDKPSQHDEDASLSGRFDVQCRKNRDGSEYKAVFHFDGVVFTEVDQDNYFDDPPPCKGFGGSSDNYAHMSKNRG